VTFFEGKIDQLKVEATERTEAFKKLNNWSCNSPRNMSPQEDIILKTIVKMKLEDIKGKL
jgi:hypothetical protein